MKKTTAQQLINQFQYAEKLMGLSNKKGGARPVSKAALNTFFNMVEDFINQHEASIDYGHPLGYKKRPTGTP